jgi:hypothetical protein
MNRSGRYRAALLAAFVLGGLLATSGMGGVAAAAEQGNATGPLVQTHVDGESVADGADVVVNSSVPVRVNASMPITAPSNASLASISLWVNGQLVYHANTSADSVSVAQTAELSPGNNTVEVEVVDSRGAMTNQSISVYRDETSPKIRLTSPAELTDDAPKDGTVVQTPVTFSGTILDDTSFSHGLLRISNPSNEYERRIEITEANFSKDVLLARDKNTIVISATDEQGNTATRRATLHLTDSLEPNVTLDEPSSFVHEGTFTVEATVTDNVWLNRAVVEVAYRNAPGNETNQRRVYVPVTSRPYNVSTDRQRVDLSQQVELSKGFNLVTVRGIDHRGHTGKREIIVEYYPKENGPPSIEVRTEGSLWIPPNESDAVKRNVSFWSEQKGSLWVNRTYAPNNSTFLLDAAVVDRDHDLDTVTVEVRRRDSDRTRVLTRTYDARGQERFRVFSELPLEFGSYLIQVRATDRRGETNTSAFTIGPPPTDMEFVDEPGALPTVVPNQTYATTTTEAPTPTTTANPEGPDESSGSLVPTSNLYLVGYVVALLVVVAGIFAVVFARR